MDEEMKRFLQEELKKEADQIMREVEADPEVADLTAPSEIDQKLYEQIKQYKEEHYAPEETLSGEQQELIRLGKIYKRKQKRQVCGAGRSSCVSICGGDYKLWRTGADIA